MRLRRRTEDEQREDMAELIDGLREALGVPHGPVLRPFPIPEVDRRALEDMEEFRRRWLNPWLGRNPLRGTYNGDVN